MINIRLFYFLRPLIITIISSILTNEVLMFICPFERQRFHRINIRDSKVVSSVWCDKNDGGNNHKKCLFENLCWLPSEEQFVFFLDEESILAGVNSWLDLSTMDFSSVEGHNRFLMQLAVITTPIGDKHPLSQYWVYEEKEWVYFIWRFKPDNIMHVLHDDLLPLYYSYEGICGGDVKSCVNKYKLIYVDDIPNNSSFELYEIFSKGKSAIGDGGPVFMRNYWRNYLHTFICFKHARVGIPRSTTWFQYGFGKPQGAVANSNLTLAIIRKFSQFLIQQMGLPIAGSKERSSKLPARALYMSRSISRRILNEVDVINATRSVYSEVVGVNSILNVQYLNPSPNSSLSVVKDILKIILNWPPPSLIFGMHGAALTVASLLSLATNVGYNQLAIMELFPMGIDPVAVSPIRALIKLPWLQYSNKLVYESWVNKDPENSVMPSMYLDRLQGGGLMCQGMDLRATLQAVHCCHNKEYLCRMFQDTRVDLKGEYLDKLRLLFFQQKELKDINAANHLEFKWYFPAAVTNVSCKWNLNTLKLELLWKNPLNIYNHEHHYDVTLMFQSEKVAIEEDLPLENGNHISSKDFFLRVSKPQAVATIPEKFIDKSFKTLKAIVWIQCVVVFYYLDGKTHHKSLDTYHECSVSL